MGELEENEMAPATNGTKETSSPTAGHEEPKETEKLLGTTKAAAAAATVKKPETPKSPSTVTVEIETPPPEKADDEKRGGEEIINIPEATSTPVAAKPPPKVSGGEGREVKPKKIPIGGIKMPGFFTKSKPKAEGDGADSELLQNAADEKTVPTAGTAEDAEKSKTDAAAKPTTTGASFMSILRQSNPFKRRPATDNDEGKYICLFSSAPKIIWLHFFFQPKNNVVIRLNLDQRDIWAKNCD